MTTVNVQMELAEGDAQMIAETAVFFGWHEISGFLAAALVFGVGHAVECKACVEWAAADRSAPDFDDDDDYTDQVSCLEFDA